MPHSRHSSLGLAAYLYVRHAVNPRYMYRRGGGMAAVKHTLLFFGEWRRRAFSQRRVILKLLFAKPTKLSWYL